MLDMRPGNLSGLTRAAYLSEIFGDVDGAPAGDHEKARTEIDQALAVGTRDAVVLYHAGVIASRLHDLPAAQGFLTQSLEVNPVSPVAEEARSALSALPRTARAAHLTDAGVAR